MSLRNLHKKYELHPGIDLPGFSVFFFTAWAIYNHHVSAQSRWERTCWGQCYSSNSSMWGAIRANTGLPEWIYGLRPAQTVPKKILRQWAFPALNFNSFIGITSITSVDYPSTSSSTHLWTWNQVTWNWLISITLPSWRTVPFRLERG